MWPPGFQSAELFWRHYKGPDKHFVLQSGVNKSLKRLFANGLILWSSIFVVLLVFDLNGLSERIEPRQRRWSPRDTPVKCLSSHINDSLKEFNSLHEVEPPKQTQKRFGLSNWIRDDGTPVHSAISLEEHWRHKLSDYALSFLLCVRNFKRQTLRSWTRRCYPFKPSSVD